MGDHGSGARKFDLEVQGTARDLGELQFNVLQSVSERRYEEAVRLLQSYREAKGKYIQYIKRTDGLFKHGEELVTAIEAKKNFPNLQSLPQNKQEELHQKALDNWEDLKVTMRRLRTIEHDMAMEDARSSIWVIKAFLFSFVLLLAVWVVNEIFRTFGQSFPEFMDESVKTFVDVFDSFF